MKIASAALALCLLTSPVGVAAAEEPTAEFLLFHHICITGYSVSACSCAFPLLVHHLPGDQVNAELKAHGGEFFSRSPMASLVVGMIQICAPQKPNVAGDGRN
jgi:hypothetical protein